MSGQCKKCGHDGCVCDGINQFHADLPKEQYEQGFKNDTPTPRTDEALHDWHYALRCMERSSYGDWVSADLARTLERELTAARDDLKNPESVELNMIRGNIAIPDRAEFDYIKQIKTLTEQRDEAWQTIAEIKRDIMDDETFGNVVVKLWQEPLDEAIEQRDRLAEALSGAVNIAVNEPDQLLSYFIGLDSPVREALQSLTTNAPDQERKSPASDGSI